MKQSDILYENLLKCDIAYLDEKLIKNSISNPEFNELPALREIVYNLNSYSIYTFENNILSIKTK